MLPPLLLAGIVSIGTMLIQLAAVALHYWNTRTRLSKQPEQPGGFLPDTGAKQFLLSWPPLAEKGRE